MFLSKVSIAIILLFPQSLFANYVNIDTVMADAAKNGSDLTEILQGITLKPTGKKLNEQSLMRVVNIKSGSVYDKLGLKSGDIVLTGSDQPKKSTKKTIITAEPVDSPSKAMEIYQDLKTVNGKSVERKKSDLKLVSFRGQTLTSKEIHLYKNFKLMSGDTIVMFDGKPLSSPQDAMTLYTGLQKNSIEQILVKRGEDFKLISLSR